MKKQTTLIRWLIDQCDTEKYRAGTLTGSKHPSVGSKLITALGGREELLSQARGIEQDLELGGKIQFQWTEFGRDIKQIDYEIEVLNTGLEIEQELLV